MQIHQKDAFNILGIEAGQANPDTIKQAYRKAAQRYHPDRNPAGLEMMKLINAAYEVVKDFNGVIDGANHQDCGNQINTALNAITGLGFTIEICGTWVWISGDTKPHKDVLKEAGFKWAPKKMLWYFRPENYKCRRHQSWSMGKIYNKYGRDVIKDEQRKLYAA